MVARQPVQQDASRQRKLLRTLDDYSASEDNNTLRLNFHSVKQGNAKHPIYKIKIRDTWLELMADSGSSINILDESNYRELKEYPKLHETSACVYPYKSNEPLKVIGKFEAGLKTEGKVTSREVVYVH